MQYQISSDNIELTKSMQNLAEDKVSKLKRFFAHFPQDEVTARIVLNKASQEDAFKAKIELVAKGKSYFAQEKEFLLETAIIRAVEEIERQLEKDRDAPERNWEKQRELKSTQGLEELGILDTE
ncbi:ribosome-associated translation inhibitor RaiA [Patescibacteria group bacterium]|nr:ribosome-associated translation inhibitor RaiA [Patescibacteria group bacterium]